MGVRWVSFASGDFYQDLLSQIVPTKFVGWRYIQRLGRGRHLAIHWRGRWRRGPRRQILPGWSTSGCWDDGLGFCVAKRDGWRMVQ